MINVTIGVEGRYELIRRKIADDSVVHTTGEFPNLITNLGLNRLGYSGVMPYCGVGSGTATPTVNDTQLQGLIGTSSNLRSTTSTRLSTTPYWVEESRVYRFDPGMATGNLSEVGVGWDEGAGFKTWSRARILDGSGNPTTITVLADEYLEVVYTIRFYPPLNTTTYNVTITGSAPLAGTYSFQTRIANVTSAMIYGNSAVTGLWSAMAYGGANTKLGPVTGGIIDHAEAVLFGYGSDSPYLDGSKRRSSVVTANIDDGNVTGGIKGMETQVSIPGTGFFYMTFQHLITPPLPKNADNGLTLNFSFTWDRYTP